MYRKLIAVIFIFWATAVGAQELSPDVQKDMHMLSLAKHLKAKEFEKSWKKIQQLKALNLELPKSLNYFEGEAACNTGRFLICDKVLRIYIDANGTSGRYYKRALELLSNSEEKIKKANTINLINRTFKVGKTFKDCDECPEMVIVPQGEFMMGSPMSEQERSKDEGPRHKVIIPIKFAVGKFELSRAEFATFVNETGHDIGDVCETFEGKPSYGKTLTKKRSGRSYENPGFRQDDTHPVVCVNWQDAKSYVSWLSRKTGKKYRLLSEAEWEYVARAKTDTPFWWGNSISTNQANYNGRYTYNGPKGTFRKKTVAVDSFEPNAFGLFNVHGNVWEWVEDCLHKNYHGAPKNGTAWTKGGNCSKRVLRGGSWRWPSLAESLRSANRSWDNSDNRSSSNGFRVSRTLAR